MSKSHLAVLAALAAQATAAQLPFAQLCSNLPKCLGDLPVINPPTILNPPGTTGAHPKQPPLVIGVVVDPHRTADPRDPNCPSGRCVIVDPKEVCDGSQPHCLPFANIHKPVLPCDQKYKKCPPGGFILNPEISCHLLDNKCPHGGVYVPLAPGDKIPPPWVKPCSPGTVGCSEGIEVAKPPKWPPVDTSKPIPGVPYNPDALCSATTPSCHPGGVIVPWHPDYDCDARYPGCLDKQIPSHPADGTGDPACPRGIPCKILNPTPCHPNEPSPPAGCLQVDPIPCKLGSPGCGSGSKLPDPIQKCEPFSIGCSKEGVRVPPAPIAHPNDPVLPSGDVALVPEPTGTLKCAWKSVDPAAFPPINIPEKTITILNPPETVTVLNPPETITFCPNPPVKPTPKPIFETQPPPLPVPIPAIVPTPEAVTPHSPADPSPPSTVKETVKETVTVTQPSPSPPAPVASTPPPPPPPTSQFACSKSDSDPCLGNSVNPWTRFTLPHQPGGPVTPYITRINNPEDHDQILTITDDLLKWEIFSVYLDGKKLGDTSEMTPDWFANCGAQPEDCIKRGWSHGYFKVPPGNHELIVQWTRGGWKDGLSPGGTYIGDSMGQWKLNSECKC